METTHRPTNLYPPKGFREDPDSGSLRCPHRDLYCCDSCVAEHIEIVPSVGVHYWISDADMRAEFAAITAEFG